MNESGSPREASKTSEQDEFPAAVVNQDDSENEDIYTEAEGYTKLYDWGIGRFQVAMEIIEEAVQRVIDEGDTPPTLELVALKLEDDAVARIEAAVARLRDAEARLSEIIE